MEKIIDQIFAATALISTISEEKLPIVLHDDHRQMLIPLVRNTMMNIATRLITVIDDINISDTTVDITFDPAIISAGLGQRVDALLRQACAYTILALAFAEASPDHSAHFRTVADASVDTILGLTSFVAIARGGRNLRTRPHVC